MRVFLSFLLSCVIISTASSQYSRSTTSNSDLFVKAAPPNAGSVAFPAKSSFISLNKAVFKKLSTNQDLIEQIRHFPMPDGSEVTLNVEQFDVLTKNAKVVIGSLAGDRPQEVVPHILLSGSIDGVNGSRVMLAVFEDHTVGYIEQEGKDRIILSPSKESTEGLSAPAIVYYQDDIPAEFRTEAWSCNSDDWMPNAKALDRAAEKIAKVNYSQMPQATTVRLIKIAVDCDFEYFKDHNSNMAKAQSYAIAVMGAMSEIYQRDVKVAVKADYLRIWDSEDPYSGTTTNELLPQFKDYWNNNMGSVTKAVGLLFSGHNGIGGLAFLDVLCDDFGFGNNYAVCGLGNNITYPTDKYVWDSDVTSHEFGHNCGSVHTHNCSWNPPIDSCVDAEGGCYNTPKARRGTIMSYCHLTSAGTDLKFHTRVSNYLKANIQSSGCTEVVQTPEVTATGSTFTCPSTPVTLSANVNLGTPPYEVLWFPKTGLDTTTLLTVKAAPTKTTAYVCRITDANNVRAFDTVIVSVDTVSVEAGNSIVGCEVDSVTLSATAKGTGKLSFTWVDAANAVVGTASTIKVSGKKSGVYKVTVIDSIGCSHSDEVTVQISTRPSTVISTAGNKTGFCEGTTLVLDAGPDFNTYKWSTGASSQQISVNTPGTYYCVVSNPGQGCEDTASITVVQFPKPAIPEVTFDGKTLTSTDGVSYQWYLGGVRIGNGKSQTYSPKSNGTYKVEVTDSNGCKATSDNIQVTLGVEEMAEIIRQVSLYPNPANNIVTIFAGKYSSELHDLFITDVNGKNIWRTNKMNAEELMLDISGWASGSYILHFSAKGESGAVKFVKE
jgi:hypothetical protein